MKYEVEITDQADSDLRGIFEHIAYELSAFQNAISQLDRLEASIYDLDTMPEKFRRYSKEPWLSRGLRVMPVDHYLVFYIPHHETRTVEIVRVMYGGRDVDAQLNQITN